MLLQPLLDYRPALVNGQGIGRYVRELSRALVGISGVEPALFGPTWAVPSFERSALGIEGARLFRRRIPSKPLTSLLRGAGIGVERLFGGHASLCHHTQYRRLPTRLPEVATIHDLVFLDTDRFMASPTAERMSAFARAAAEQCAAIITPTEVVADEVAERLDVPRERIFATHLGVDHVHRGAAERASAPSAAPYFLSAARNETRKNLVTVLRAFEALGSDVRWKVAGTSGAGGEALDEALRGSPARDRVDRLGHVDETRLRELVQGALAFVLVPLDEGFGLAPLEAMALGVSAISSNVPVVREVCGGGAVLVDPLDVDALTAALERLAGDAEERARQAALGSAHAARFTWARTAEATLAAYRSVSP
ncbi:MAG: glycosyltransferase family 1 protein [Planctomycetota bacterium]